MDQIGSVLKAAGNTSGWALVERVSGDGSLYAYGVANDNVTNDGGVPGRRARDASGFRAGRALDRRDLRVSAPSLLLVNPGACLRDA